jgi:hypothetical protein
MRAFRAGLDGGPSQKSTAACLLAVFDDPRRATEEINFYNTDQLEGFFDCVTYSKNIAMLQKLLEERASVPHSIVRKIKFNLAVLQNCNCVVDRVPVWAQSWRYKLYAAAQESKTLRDSCR